MKNYKPICFLFAAGVLLTLVIAVAEENKHPENVAIADPDPGNFEKDVSDATAKMKETLRVMRRNKFFGNLYNTINKGDIKTAEQLLGEHIRKFPEYKKDENYLVAKSKIAYAKGDYQTAYAEADKFIADIEKAFAPRKPYEVDFKDSGSRDGVEYAYILRYQATAGMRRYAEALADLNCALRIETTPELLRAKTGTLLALHKYAEAADASDKASGMDKTIFVSSPYRNHYCWLFSEHGYKVKDCAYFAALARERAAAEKTAQ